MKKIIGLFVFLFFVGMQIVSAQTKQVTGTVTSSEDGLGIPGVSVIIYGTTIGTTTDINGKYAIKTKDSDVLLFSFVGMIAQELKVGGRKQINVVMKPNVVDMDEVIVVGYGIKRKGTITGSVATVGAEKLEQVPVASFDNALQGQSAGVQVISSSGRPGRAATIRIRGKGSVNAGTDPLFIMDGIPISNDDFSALNPNDIEQISILKDAASTSIYGARGANGVVVISTKRGRSLEKTEITYRGQYGVSVLAREKFDMMNTKQKLDYEEALGLKTEGGYDRASLEKIQTNWRDEVFRNAPMQSHEISARGGNAKTRFFISGSLFDQEGIQYRSDFKRYTGRINIDHNASENLKFGTSILVGLEENNFTVEASNNVYNPGFVTYLLNSYLRPRRDDGSYTTRDDGLTWANPLQQLEMNEDFSSKLKIVGNVYAEMKLTDFLKVKTSLGGDFYDRKDDNYLHPKSAWGMSSNGTVSRGFSREFKMNNVNQIIFNKTFNDIHEVTAFIGEESLERKYEYFNVEGKKLPNDKVKVLSTTAEPGDYGGSISEYSLLSFFGSASYNYDEKYFVDLTYRREGSSRFGVDTRWADFWAMGLMWDAKSEAFLENNEAFSALKMKFSAGTTGNWEIGNYLHQSLYGYTGTYNDENASFPSSPGNPELTWEKVTKYNLGAEVGLFNRWNFQFDVYHETTSQMLFEVPFSRTTGFGGGWGNVGEMVNKGVELTINADILKLGDFNWNLSANVSYNQSEITELYGDVTELPNSDNNTIIKVGEPYGSMYITRFAGVDPANGKSLWLTKDGNITNTFSENDATLFGHNWIAPWNGGFTNTFTYKGLSVQAFFSWVKDKYMLNNTRYFIESNGQFGSFNQTTRMMNYWKKPGDVTDIPYPDGNNYFDSRLIEDASFMRLKNLIVAYTLPKSLMSKIKGISSVRVYAQGQNLLTFSKYQGFDPEVDEAVELGMYPQVKTVTFGVDVKF